jgi:putative oxidoreductase
LRLISRVLIGGLFVGHGTQKLFGWFSGHGLDGTAGYFEALGLHPGTRNALVAGVAEAGGGALFARGLALPLAGAALAGTMTTAIRHVHGPKGPWTTDGGAEREQQQADEFEPVPFQSAEQVRETAQI